MEEIRIDIIIEPSIPFEFLKNGEAHVKSIRMALEEIKQPIIMCNGYVEIKQKKDGTCGITCHAEEYGLIKKMDELIRIFCSNI